MDEEELAPHIEEIRKALGEEITEDKIKEELEKYADLGILLSEAKRAIIKNYGGSVGRSDTPVTRKLDQVEPTDSNIEVVAKIISANEKEVNVSGGSKLIVYGLLADDTMARPYTSWNYLQLQKGDIVRAKSAYVKEFRGEMQVNFGNNTVVEHLDGTTFENIDFDSIKTSVEFAPRRISELAPGTRNFELKARITEVISREISSRGETKTIFTGTLADETGSISFTAWNDFSLNVGEVVNVKGGYIKNWRGIIQFNFDQNAEIEKVDAEDMPSLEELSKVETFDLKKLVDQMSIQRAICEGTVINVRQGSGLIFRCPECNKLLRENNCLVHGEQEGVADLRIKATLDDGTGCVTVMLNRSMTEELLGTDLDAYRKMAQDAMDANVVYDDMEKKILDLIIKVTGTIRRDDFGPTIFTDKVERITVDLNEKAKELKDQMEGL
jgi:replication factor A1